MSRLPNPGSDDGLWGNVLNDFLGQSLASDGTVKAGAIGSDQVQDNSLPKTKLAPSVQASLTKADAASPNVEVINTVTNAGASQTLPDPSVQSISRLTLTQNCTLTLPTATAGKSFTLVLVQGGSGSYTISCAAAKWPGGIVPVLSTAVSAVDYLSFACVDGSTWAGFVAGLDVK
jgi:hypothetical protein